MSFWRPFLHWSAVGPFVLWPLTCGWLRLDPTIALWTGVIAGLGWTTWRLSR